jgi:hypothetical protein
MDPDPEYSYKPLETSLCCDQKDYVLMLKLYFCQNKCVVGVVEKHM